MPQNFIDAPDGFVYNNFENWFHDTKAYQAFRQQRGRRNKPAFPLYEQAGGPISYEKPS